MSAVMLDVEELRIEIIELELLDDLRRQVADSRSVGESPANRGERWPLRDDELSALKQTRIRVPIHCDGIDPVDTHSRGRQAIADGRGRKSSPVLDTPEPLFFVGNGLEDEFAVGFEFGIEVAHLIDRRKEGSFQIVKLNAEALMTAERWMSYYRKFWNDRLDILQELLEKGKV